MLVASLSVFISIFAWRVVLQLCLKTVCLLGLSLVCTSSLFAQSGESAAIELDEIIVEEEGEPEADLPLGLGISGSTLSTAPGAGGDPVRALQSLPGMAFTDDEESLPAVRGSRPGDNYFQSDFSPVGYLFHFGGLISIFNTDIIESFDIYQSAYGPEFSGVTGGVFDIKLRKPKTDRLRAKVDISFLHAGALVEGPINENQSFYLAGRFSYLDLLLAGQIDNEGEDLKIIKFPEYSDYQGKYVWKLDESSTLTAQFNGANDEAQLDIEEGSEDIETDPIFAGSFIINGRFHEQALVWDKQVGENLTFKTLLSHVNETEEGMFGGVGTVDITSDRYLLKNRTNIVLNDQHELVVGTDLLREDADTNLALSLVPCGELDPDCFFTGSQKLESKKKIGYNQLHAYIKDNWYINDKLTLYPGVAVQYEDFLDNHFIEPRLAMEYSLSDTTLLSAGIGQYQQAPDYLELDDTFGNPDIDYSNALHAQVGIARDVSSDWFVKSELYYKTLDKLVTTDDELNYTNEGAGHAFGLDTLIRKNLTDKFSGWASISFSQARRKDKRTGEEFVFDHDQPLNVSLVSNYKFNKKWSVGAKLWVHSGAPVTPVVGAVEDSDKPGFYRPIFGKLNSDRFPTYHRLDLRIDRTFQRKKDNTMGAYVEFFNILRARNAADYDYNADYTEKTLALQTTGYVSVGFKATF